MLQPVHAVLAVDDQLLLSEDCRPKLDPASCGPSVLYLHEAPEAPHVAQLSCQSLAKPVQDQKPALHI